METERLEKLLALVLLELAATRHVCSLDRAARLQTAPGLRHDAAALALARPALDAHLDTAIAALKDLGLEDAAAWAVAVQQSDGDV